MGAYLIRRLLLVIPTLLAIMVINFAIVQAAPGGPIDVVVISRAHGVQWLRRKELTLGWSKAKATAAGRGRLARR